MKKVTLYEIANGIIGAKEWLEINTASAQAVRDYAENGMDISITNVQAEKILKAIKNWLAYDGPEPQHNRYILLEKPLSTRTGGSRPGAGRPQGPVERKTTSFKISEFEKEKIRELLKELRK